MGKNSLENVTVHPFAEVQDSAIVGGGSVIWQFASLIRGARVGEHCSVASCAIIDGAIIGNNCTIGHGASVHPGVVLGNEVFVGPAAVFCNDPWPRVRKGDFDIKAILNGFVVTRVGDGASIGAGAIVLPGMNIGAGAMVAAGVVVERSVPDFHIYKRTGEIVEIERRQVSRMRRAA